MNTKLMVLLLIAIVFSPVYLYAVDEDKAPAALAAGANAATDNGIDVADEFDDFALEDEDLIADEDLALDEDLEEAPAL